MILHVNYFQTFKGKIILTFYRHFPRTATSSSVGQEGRVVSSASDGGNL